MFDCGGDGWDGVPADVLASYVPPPVVPEVPDAEWDAWIDSLAAGDPQRPRTPAEVVRDAEHAPVTSELGAVDVSALDDDAKIALLVAADRQISHLTAVKLRAAASFTGRLDPTDRTTAGWFAWAEIGAALGIGEGTARHLNDFALTLTHRLPATFAALLAADITPAKARTIVEATAGLSDDQAREVENLVLGKAQARTHAAHTAAVGRAVRKIDPDGWQRRREQRLADVALIRSSEGDGVASILARNLDSLDAELLWTAADTYARHHKTSGDPRTLDALRVAFLIDAAKHYLTTGQPSPAAPRPTTPAPAERADADRDHTGDEAGATASPTRPPTPPTRHGMPAVVNVIIGLPSLAGGSDEPGLIAGNGDPLPADAVADLLHTGARIRFALTDTTGNLVGISTTLHDPRALQRAYLALRDVTLRIPTGSTTPTAGHDSDHIDPHGPTEPANLHHPSRGWHRAKTFRHWTIHANPDRTITWTSRRTGRTYTTEPYDYRAGP